MISSETLGQKKPHGNEQAHRQCERDSFPTPLFKIQHNQSLLTSLMKNISLIVFTFTSLIRSNFVSFFICVFFFYCGQRTLQILLDRLTFCYLLESLY